MQSITRVVRHYNGSYYRVLFEAEDADKNGVAMVIYQQLQGKLHRPLGHLWTRSAVDFYAQDLRIRSTHGAYPDRRIRYRFKPVAKIPAEIARAIARLDARE
jgi:hypothetical protein